jgi:hypothetical protein
MRFVPAMGNRRRRVAVARASGRAAEDGTDAALRAATLARLCRAEGGYARPTVPLVARSCRKSCVRVIGMMARFVRSLHPSWSYFDPSRYRSRRTSAPALRSAVARCGMAAASMNSARNA